MIIDITSKNHEVFEWVEELIKASYGVYGRDKNTLTINVDRLHYPLIKAAVLTHVGEYCKKLRLESGVKHRPEYYVRFSERPFSERP